MAGCQSALPPNHFQKCLTFVILTTVCLPLSPPPTFLSLSVSLFDSDVRGTPRLCRFRRSPPSAEGKVKFSPPSSFPQSVFHSALRLLLLHASLRCWMRRHQRNTKRRFNRPDGKSHAANMSNKHHTYSMCRSRYKCRCTHACSHQSEQDIHHVIYALFPLGKRS